MTIERNFDVPFVANLALREKQIQQNYRPIIAVHKWFARRPGTLFRSLILSEFAKPPLNESFYKSNNLKGLRIADPFMGGGTPLVEANRIGCDVIGFDINPMSYWIVRQEIEHLDINPYRISAKNVRDTLEKNLGSSYRTTCLICGSNNAHVKYFLWVKQITCAGCGKDIDLFPGYLLSEDRRHPKNVFVCSKCGELTETGNRKYPGNCHKCGVPLTLTGPAKRNLCRCPDCNTMNRFPDPLKGAPGHRMFSIEYYCPKCKEGHAGRFFKKPDEDDLQKYAEAESLWLQMKAQFVPDEEIPSGVETDRLHRWGYRKYRDMFNARQLLGLELGCQIISKEKDERIRNALATNLSDLLRYQNMLCRYDTMALKSLDIFSVHGFPVGLIQCESNILGIANGKTGVNIGSGGWSNIIDKFAKAKSYCLNPFEIRHNDSRKIVVPVEGEWIGDVRNNSNVQENRRLELYCRDAAEAEIPEVSLDAVLTDPPYYGNVQYAELMDFCYVWLRRLVGSTTPFFHELSTRNYGELTGNENMGRGLEHFAQGLSKVFQRMKKALKPGAPLAFTYHHNTFEVYLPIAMAILDADLTCSASLPCPAEMGASIHISGTKSSIVDTVFVCRTTGKVPRKWITDTPSGIAQIVVEDIDNLNRGGVKPTQGDIRCLIFGHLIRLAIWSLRHTWDKERICKDKLKIVAEWINNAGGVDSVLQHLPLIWDQAPTRQTLFARESEQSYAINDEISF